MTDKDVKKLNRMELLEILVELSDENDRLKAEVEDLNDEIDDLNELLAAREIMVKNAGSIADASLSLTNIFVEAQRAADLYLENIRRQEEENRTRSAAIIGKMEENCAAAEQKVRDSCMQLEDETRAECDRMEAEAREKCALMMAQARSKCAEMLRAAAAESTKYRRQTEAAAPVQPTAGNTQPSGDGKPKKVVFTKRR